MEIRYFFVTDNVARDKMSIKYCPTDDMLADYYTKPVQGSKCRKFRQRILNLPHNPNFSPQECVAASPHGVLTPGHPPRSDPSPIRAGIPSRERKPPRSERLTVDNANAGVKSSGHTSMNINIVNRRMSIAKLLGKRSYMDVLKTAMSN